MRRFTGGALILVAILYGMLPAVQILAYAETGSSFKLMAIIDYAIAIAAYFWILNDVVLAAKIPMLQRLLPYDRGVRLHVLGGVGVIFFTYVHAFYKLLSGIFIDPVSLALLVLFSLVFVVAVIWVRTPIFGFVFRFIGRLRREPARYDRTRSIHRWLGALMGLLMLVHITYAGVLGSVPAWSSAVYLIYFLFVVVVFFSALIRRHRTVQVRLIGKSRAGSVQVLHFERPKGIRYRPGQFGYLRIMPPTSGGYEAWRFRKEIHPFSFLSIPSENTVSFGVSSRGDFTGSLGDLPAGTVAQILGGFGGFTPRYDRPLCLIGTGVGMVPVLSILKQVLAERSETSVTAYLVTRSPEDLVEPETIHAFENGPPYLTIHPIFTRHSHERLTAERFARDLGNPGLWQCYICSSDAVRGSIIRELEKFGIPARRIRYEKFGLT